MAEGRKEGFGNSLNKELSDATAAMKVDVPCIPDYVTLGQEQDIIVKFIRKNMLLTIARTTRVVPVAFQEAFPCPANHGDTAK